ncbi:hypothetical protein CAEBREN_31304 [Caenorhabditis brenneri]|uniref:Uncharacterized protein n=1 Tax=Caenorhabditis brenneri TaxID=135651 RepID=G0NY72_CAEBE|nr:hypothetical protein CAEBREN_31304 [Caenorhabditis brenneri]
MDDFYITLPSTVPNPQHKNTSSRYVTRLPEVLNLERDKYVVAASDVIYPYSYVNVGKQLDYWIHFKSRLPIHISIPPAQYSDAAQIINTLNGSQVRLKRSAALALVDSEIARVKRARTDEVGNLDADITSLDDGKINQIDGVFEPIADEYSMLEGPGHAATEEETIGDEFGDLAAADKNVETIGKEFGALAADENVETIGKEFGALAADENVETIGKEFDALAAADKGSAKNVETIGKEFDALAAADRKSDAAKSEKSGVAKSEKSGGAKSEKSGVAKSEKSEKSGGAKSEKSGVAKSEKSGVAKFEKSNVAKSEKSNVAKSEKSEKSKKLLFEQQVFDDDAMPPSASSYQVPPPVEVPERETRFDKRKLQEERVLEQAMDEEYQALDSPPPTSIHQAPPPVEVPEKETRFDRKKLQEERVLEQAMDEEYQALDSPPPTSSHQVPPPVEVPEKETRFDRKKLQEERVLEQAMDEEYQALDSPPPTSIHQVPPPVEVPEKETRFDRKKLQEGRVLDSSGQTIADEYAAIDSLDDDELSQIDSEFAKLARARIEHEAAARAYTAAQAAVVNVVGDETIYSQAVEMLKKQRARITTESRPSSRDFLKFTIVADTLHCDFLDADILFVELDEPCAYFLGFVDPIVRKSQKAEKKIDYFGNVSTLYLYCDVVDPIIVGNTKSALLSVIPCQGAYGEMIHHTVTHPRYLPLVKSTIDSIRVDFLTEFGEPINFNWGSTIVVLHFKQRSR